MEDNAEKTLSDDEHLAKLGEIFEKVDDLWGFWKHPDKAERRWGFLRQIYQFCLTCWSIGLS